MRKIRIQTTTSTTTPGDENANGQVVVRDTGFASATFPRQRVYHLRCKHCGFEYGSNGIENGKRRCPHCQGGVKGELLREAGPGLFDQG